MKTRIFLLLVALFFIQWVTASSYLPDERKFSVLSSAAPITVDGILDEEVWDQAKVLTDFIQERPYNGSPSEQISIVKVLYDNSAVYVSAVLSYKNMEINDYMTQRDRLNNTDYFGVALDPYADGAISYNFFITPYDVQTDFKTTRPNNEDYSWNAVWYAKSKREKDHWVLEMKIPFSAIRFSKKASSTWGINFHRMVMANKELSSWNRVNDQIEGRLTQMGKVDGFDGIEPPMRLSFLPYVSTALGYDGDDKQLSKNLNYGMDLKWGINESFTLDMTMIPDFGQVRSDDKVLNLSPFEVFYAEQRPFFTEGTELFSKGGIFYSRRIGGRPLGRKDIKDEYDEEATLSNPDAAPLLNATKLSGKTASGLGIGVFNAITDNTFAEVVDSTGKTRKIMTQPLSNYNMWVMDKTVGNFSNISVYNTNVYRGGLAYTANVTGTSFRAVDANNEYAFSGLLNVSQIYDAHEAPDFGYKSEWNVGKISGNFKYNFWQTILSDTYDHNDMGFLRTNNLFNNGINLFYNNMKPFGMFLSTRNNFWLSYSALYRPMVYKSVNTGFNLRATFRNYMSVGAGFWANPFGVDDYYESRDIERVFKKPTRWGMSFWVSPDYRKPFLVDASMNYSSITGFDLDQYELRLAPRLRLSSRMLLTYEMKYNWRNNEKGYVSDSLDNSSNKRIFFGNRDVKTFTNTIESNYVFSATSNLSFRLRHYWSRVAYNKYYDLNNYGDLEENKAYVDTHNKNYNNFTIDLIYTWNFAPGSELVAIWKNKVNHSDEIIIDDLIGNYGELFDQPQMNEISLKVLFYIDYQNLKRRVKRLPLV